MPGRGIGEIGASLYSRAEQLGQLAAPFLKHSGRIQHLKVLRCNAPFQALGHRLLRECAYAAKQARDPPRRSLLEFAVDHQQPDAQMKASSLKSSRPICSPLAHYYLPSTISSSCAYCTGCHAHRQAVEDSPMPDEPFT